MVALSVGRARNRDSSIQDVLCRRTDDMALKMRHHQRQSSETISLRPEILVTKPFLVEL
jgi:hypothetical protein